MIGLTERRLTRHDDLTLFTEEERLKSLRVQRDENRRDSTRSTGDSARLIEI